MDIISGTCFTQVMSSHLVQGRCVDMPVRVREASACSVMFAVPARVARSTIEHSGLDVVEPVPGRALCSLAFVRYVDGDLGRYHEFAVAFLVRAPRGRRPGAFIHRLPVDQSFTLEAGRTIWGFPKCMADIDLRSDGPVRRCTVRQDGRLVVDLLVRRGLPVPGGIAAVDAYTHLDGTTRRIPWTVRPSGLRGRPGGARIRLGDHPVADELARLGLPRTALLTSTIDNLAMEFQDAETCARS